MYIKLDIYVYAYEFAKQIVQVTLCSNEKMCTVHAKCFKEIWLLICKILPLQRRVK